MITKNKLKSYKDIQKELEDIDNLAFKDGIWRGIRQARKEIKEFIEDERDNGNTEEYYSNGRVIGFSAALCVSNLLKELER